MVVFSSLEDENGSLGKKRNIAVGWHKKTLMVFCREGPGWPMVDLTRVYGTVINWMNKDKRKGRSAGPDYNR